MPGPWWSEGALADLPVFVLDVRADQLKDGWFLRAAALPVECRMFSSCSLGRRSVLGLQYCTGLRSQRGPGVAQWLPHDTYASAHPRAGVLTSQPPHHSQAAPLQLLAGHLRVNGHCDPFWPLAPWEPPKEKTTNETLSSYPLRSSQTEMGLCSSVSGGGKRGLWWARSICREPSRVSWPMSAEVTLIIRVLRMHQWQLC